MSIATAIVSGLVINIGLALVYGGQMITRMENLERRAEASDARDREIAAEIGRLSERGSQRLPGLESDLKELRERERQTAADLQVLSNRIDRLDTPLAAVVKDIQQRQTKMLETLPLIEQKVQDLRAYADRQTQALDATYNMITEHIRLSPHPSSTEPSLAPSQQKPRPR